ncbi:MAG: DUF371 domain-containing protein [Sulfolobales archaeon]
MIIVESFRARGHENIRARHRTTLEITRESDLTPRGDCIVAVSSEKSVADLSQDIKEGIRRGFHVALIIRTRNAWDYVIGRGSPMLVLSDPFRIVVRRSGFIDQKTLMIHASKAASDLDRKLIEDLRARDSIVDITIIVSKSLDDLIKEINYSIER